MMSNDEVLHEEAPNAPGAEEWIKKHKLEFKKRYGSNWARILYAKAWILYGKNATNGDRWKNEASHITVAVSATGSDGKKIVTKVIQQTLTGGGLDVQTTDKSDITDKKLPSDVKNFAKLDETVKSFVPPSEVQATARKGLEMRKEHDRGGWDSRTAGANGIGSGVVRAQTLAGGRGVSLDTVKRMRSFFQRHDGKVERAARLRDETSAANIAWLLWGGDPGRVWVEKLLGDKNG